MEKINETEENEQEDNKVLDAIIKLVTSLPKKEQKRMLDIIRFEQGLRYGTRLKNRQRKRYFTDDEMALVLLVSRIDLNRMKQPSRAPAGHATSDN